MFTSLPILYCARDLHKYNRKIFTIPDSNDLSILGLCPRGDSITQITFNIQNYRLKIAILHHHTFKQVPAILVPLYISLFKLLLRI